MNQCQDSFLSTRLNKSDLTNLTNWRHWEWLLLNRYAGSIEYLLNEFIAEIREQESISAKNVVNQRRGLRQEKRSVKSCADWKICKRLIVLLVRQPVLTLHKDPIVAPKYEKLSCHETFVSSASNLGGMILSATSSPPASGPDLNIMLVIAPISFYLCMKKHVRVSVSRYQIMCIKDQFTWLEETTAKIQCCATG